MSAPGAMPRSARDERADQMLADYEDGFGPTEIAERMGVTRRLVYLRLSALGVTFDNAERKPESLWNLPDDQRRTAINNRAAKAARELLKSF